MLHLLLSSGGGARRRRRSGRRAPAEDQQVRPIPPPSPVRGRPPPAADLPLAPHEPLPDRHRGGERRSPGGAPARVGTTAAATSSAPAARAGTGRICHTASPRPSGGAGRGDDGPVGSRLGADGLLDEAGEARGCGGGRRGGGT